MWTWDYFFRDVDCGYDNRSRPVGCARTKTWAAGDGPNADVYVRIGSAYIATTAHKPAADKSATTDGSTDAHSHPCGGNRHTITFTTDDPTHAHSPPCGGNHHTDTVINHRVYSDPHDAIDNPCQPGDGDRCSYGDPSTRCRGDHANTHPNPAARVGASLVPFSHCGDAR